MPAAVAAGPSCRPCLVAVFAGVREFCTRFARRQRLFALVHHVVVVPVRVVLRRVHARERERWSMWVLVVAGCRLHEVTRALAGAACWRHHRGPLSPMSILPTSRRCGCRSRPVIAPSPCLLPCEPAWTSSAWVARGGSGVGRSGVTWRHFLAGASAKKRRQPAVWFVGPRR